jgi:hypothetical protein
MRPRLSLQEKLDRDMPLNKSELIEATGYGWRAIKRINPPFVCGKIRRSDFWSYAVLPGIPITTTVASPEQLCDLRSIADSSLHPSEQGNELRRERELRKAVFPALGAKTNNHPI